MKNCLNWSQGLRMSVRPACVRACMRAHVCVCVCVCVCACVGFVLFVVFHRLLCAEARREKEKVDLFCRSPTSH